MGLDMQLEAARRGAETVPEGLRRMAEMAQQVFEEMSEQVPVTGGQIPIFLEFWTKASRDPAVWQATIAPYRRYQALLANLVEQGIAEGSLRPVNPEAAAQLILSLAVGLLLQGLLDPQGADWGQVAQESLQMLLQGLGRGE